MLTGDILVRLTAYAIEVSCLFFSLSSSHSFYSFCVCMYLFVYSHFSILSLHIRNDKFQNTLKGCTGH